MWTDAASRRLYRSIARTNCSSIELLITRTSSWWQQACILSTSYRHGSSAFGHKDGQEDDNEGKVAFANTSDHER